jgi:hypothetical protein
VVAGTPITCCQPCRLPNKDLTYEVGFYAYVDDFGTNTSYATLLSTKIITLTYASTGPNFNDKTWTGSVLCPDGVSRQVQMTCALNDPGIGLSAGGRVTITGPPCFRTYIAPYSIGTWTAQSGFPEFSTQPMFSGTVAATGGTITGSYVCNPIAWQDNYTAAMLFNNVSGAYNKVSDPTPDTYVGRCCLTPITVGGCNSAVLPGATYSIWVDSTKDNLIDSGTTDSSGIVTLDALFCGVSVYREVSHPRFVTLTGSKSFNGVSGSDSITTPISGYRCLFGCGAPVANTIHATFSTAGAKTLVNSGSGWTVSFTASTHAYVVTINADGTMTITRDGVSCGSATFTINACPPAFSGTITVPTGTCATEIGASASVSE